MSTRTAKSTLASYRDAGTAFGPTTASTTGSPASSSVNYGGTTYDALQWTANGTWVCGVSGWVDVVVVGGGGPGYSSANVGGGGGGVISKRVYATAGTTYTITVGGTRANESTSNGLSSAFGDLIALGGGYGGAAGNSGGSLGTGGGGNTTQSPLIAGQGYSGSSSGAGGGAGGAASGTTGGVGLVTWAGTFGAGGPGGGTGSAPAANSGGGGASASPTAAVSAAGAVWLGIRRS